MQPTPEMIEAHARHCWNLRYGDVLPWDTATDNELLHLGVDIHQFRRDAEEALTAALAVAPAQGVGNVRGMQNCAREIATLVDEYDPRNSDWSFRKAIIREMLARILSVLEPAPNEVSPPANGVDAAGKYPVAPRERPKRSIRLMTDAERSAVGLDPNGGFDGPTGAD